MAHYRLSPQAEQDIEAILAWTHEEFGEKARLRYEALLIRAILDVAEAPECVGSHDRPEIVAGARTYHLRHSRDHVKRSVGRVRRPRHFLLYRTIAEGGVEVGRILHDSMDLSRHLPDDYRVQEPDE
ncbi:type II toxin-antitoxin system RelE/ParE family toxin [Tautonia sociabilis]|uniref:Type II toxin-antitoxin system RelE/ParE family toxin n=1 Tax=Tautonia sociabilis TaxID=2080755 RepID=A0A432MF70_9BACT|nr:type II toxin-antitoxin system RelE/ParE family toxin [Tautonia sociabilis]RUL84611.1 type II toxin-antitoxin system RelE/ParE family toxin [Tautonia sociabilis]